MAEHDNFTELFLRHGGKAIDKWEHYLRVYDYELSALVAAGRPLRFLEIGVQNGGSLELWSKLLPEGSEIHGIDIDPQVSSLEFESKHIRVNVADATDSNRLEEILGSEIFDIIIDDGSHICDDVRHSFEILFPRLALGGRYVIEDLACSYDSHYGGGFKSAGSSIEYLKHLVDCLHSDYLQPDAVDADAMNKVSPYNRFLGRITFYDSIAIIEKLSFEKTRPYQRILGGDATAVQPFSNWLPFFSTSKLQGLLFAHPAVRQFEQAFFTELDQRRGEVIALSSKVAELSLKAEAQKISLDGEIDRLNQDIASMEARYANLERELHARHIELLRASLQREQEFSTQLTEIQKQSAQEHAAREVEHAEQIARLRETLESTLRKSVEREQTLNKRIEFQQEMLANLRMELAVMQHSLSWTLTAPLRAAVRYLGGASPARPSSSMQPLGTDLTVGPENLNRVVAPDGEGQRAISSPPANNSKLLEDPSWTTSLTSLGAAPDLKTLLQYQDTQFIRCAYMTLLKREPDPQGFTHYVGRLRDGEEKLQILSEMYASREAKECGAELPWLHRAVRRQRLTRLPIVGIVISPFLLVRKQD